MGHVPPTLYVSFQPRLRLTSELVGDSSVHPHSNWKIGKVRLFGASILAALAFAVGRFDSARYMHAPASGQSKREQGT